MGIFKYEIYPTVAISAIMHGYSQSHWLIYTCWKKYDHQRKISKDLFVKQYLDQEYHYCSQTY